MVDPACLAGWQVSKPVSLVDEILRAPFEDRRACEGGRSSPDAPSCNLGFRLLEGDRIQGHFIWPELLDREFSFDGLSDDEMRARLVDLGHLAAENSSTFLPRQLVPYVARGYPQAIARGVADGNRDMSEAMDIDIRVPVLAIRGLHGV